VTRARAKINLWLKVVGKRADGYHLLDSLVAFADLGDTLDAAPADTLSLAVDGPQSGSLAAESDNLVLKAARALAASTGVAARAALRLTKNIPVAAGLGGGSADAAAALRALVELWRVALPDEQLFDLAGTLGADVPMCLAGRTAIASGIGDRLAPAPALPSCGLLLVNPGVALAPKDVSARHQLAHLFQGVEQRLGRLSGRRDTGQALVFADRIARVVGRQAIDGARIEFEFLQQALHRLDLVDA